MEGSIRLSVAERKILLRVYRSGSSTHRARHAHILLLLDDGHSYRLIHELLYASYDLIASTVRRYREEGLDAIVGPPTTTEATVPLWMLQIVKWLTTSQPEDFGYLRRRWTCAMLREVLFWETKQHVTAEQVRCGLRKMKFVWRRPRPVVGLLDPEFELKLVKIQDLLATLPSNEAALFQDEVDVHLNPKIDGWLGSKRTRAAPSTFDVGCRIIPRSDFTQAANSLSCWRGVPPVQTQEPGADARSKLIHLVASI